MPLKSKTYYIWNWRAGLGTLPAVTEPNKQPEKDPSAGKRLDALLRSQGMERHLNTDSFKQMPIFVVETWKKDRIEVARIIHGEYISDVWPPAGESLERFFIPLKDPEISD